ncbi:hypothetical protein K443DRAFT_687240, partial [Laccaria amethystina LaAM-08-1]
SERGEPDDTRASRPPQEFVRVGQPSFGSVLAADSPVKQHKMSTAGRLASPLPRAPMFHRLSSRSHRRGLQPGHIPEARCTVRRRALRMWQI